MIKLAKIAIFISYYSIIPYSVITVSDNEVQLQYKQNTYTLNLKQTKYLYQTTNIH